MNPPTVSRPPRAVFTALVVVMFFLTLSAADSVGFVPYYIDGSSPRPVADASKEVALADLPQLGEQLTSDSSQLTENAAAAPTYLPARISIPAIALDLPIYNPTTKDAAGLDDVLLKGPARYVDSAKLGEKGNMLIFAHSSHLPVVHNQMFKAFNSLPDLKKGDTITVSGEGHAYLYSVTSVRKADASEAIIDLSADQGMRLTLSTCDNFGAKTSRWVVEATLVGEI